MEKIFVSIPSYRDFEIVKTVKNLLETAKYPNNLKIVVFEQIGKEDISIFDVFPSDQVFVISTHFQYAKGPLWARYIIQQYYNNEEYFLQIDSHTRMINDWDVKLKNMLMLCPEPSVLTQYPAEYSLYDETMDQRIRSGLYVQGFGKEGFTRIQSNFSKQKRYFPYTSKGWSACFSFSKGNFVKEIPYDPLLIGLFFGEEFDIAIRLFTKGWYIYSPCETVVYTCFKRNYRRTYWEDVKDIKNISECARKILDDKIKNPKIGLYEMGDKRTVKEYMNFAEIENYETKKMKKNAKTFRKFTSKIILR